MKTPGLFIAGLGVYLPPVMSTQTAAEEGLYDTDDARWHGWTGAAIAGDMPAPDMAILAAQQAMERSGHHRSEIDVHIHACGHEQGPEGWSAQHYVLRHVADSSTTSYRVWQSCNGMMAALELAACCLLAVPDRTAALLTGADNLGTPNVNRWSPGIDNSIFGDSGSALILSRRSGIARLLAVSSASMADVEEIYRGTEPLFPPSLTVGRPFNVRDRLDSSDQDAGEALADIVLRQSDLRTEVALRALAEADITTADITRVAHVFVGHERHLRPVLGPIGIANDRGVLELGRNLGHLTVSDQIAGLDHLIETCQVGPGDHVLMLGHGGGVSVAAAVVRIEAAAGSPRPGG